MTERKETDYAPAERASTDRVDRQADALAASPLLATILDNLQELVLILNQQRQIVFANRRFTEFLGAPDATGFFGQRPGEAVSCVYALARETPNGCGTSEFCRTCGAVNAILNSQQSDGGSDIQECSIIREGDAEPLNFRVRATRFPHDGETYTMFAFEDISHEKRREELERVFFHDILNTAGAVRGLADILEMVPADKQTDFRHRISQGASRLIDEINSQRIIAAAERGDLTCNFEPVGTQEFLAGILALFEGHSSAEGRHLVVPEDTIDTKFETDRGLLSRVVVNMIKNALEATSTGGTVTVGCETVADKIRFWTHNVAAIEESVAKQIFQRSFSTKGKGRGLGSYSMRLIGERYLEGRITFCTDEESGTVFSAAFPVHRH
jgi:signal transduction histidine kinase